MKTSIFLANRFIKAHRFSSILSVLIISFFVAMLQATLIYNSSYQSTLELNLAKKYGRESGIVYSADISQAKEYLINEPEIYTPVLSSYKVCNSENTFYVGYMPQKALQSKEKKLVKGRFPQNKGEATIELYAYEALGINADIGEAFFVTVLENGEEVTNSYILCGITEGYLLDWQKGDNSKKSFNYPPPVIITTYNESDPIAFLNIICDETPQDAMGGEYVKRGLENDNINIMKQKNSVFFVTSPIASFLALVMAFGVYTVLKYTMNERDVYINLLQKIGMTRKKCGYIYMVMSVYLVLSSCILGSLLGVIVSFVASKCFTALSSGQELVFSYNIGYAGTGCLICAVTIIVSFLISIKRHYRTAKKERLTVRATTPAYTQSIKLSKLMKRARFASFRVQNFMTGMLMFFSVFVACFGLFFSRSSVMLSHTSIAMGEHQNYGDIELFISSGSTSVEYYYINRPEGSGISQNNFDKLISKDAITLKNVIISETIGGAVTYNPKDNNEYFDKQLTDETISTEITRDKVPTYDTAINKINALPEEKLFHIRVSGVPYDVLVKRYLPHTDDANEIDKDSYEKGLQVLASSSIYNVGDRVRLLTVSTADKSLDVSNPDRFCFATTEAIVTAVSPYVDGIVISSEYIVSNHPNAKYSVVEIDINADDEMQIKQLTAHANSIAATSQYISVTNNIEEQKEYENMLASSDISSWIMILVFVLLTSVAVVISAKLKTNTNIQSFLLLRAIGADKDTITSLAVYEGVIPCVIGGTSAIVLSLALSFAISSHYNYLPLGTIMMQSMITGTIVALIQIILSVAVSYRQVESRLE